MPVVVSTNDDLWREEPLLDSTSQRPLPDPLLNEFLTASSETDREAAVSRLLLGHAYDPIAKILSARFKRARLESDQIEDLRHEVIVRLVRRFRQLRDFEENPIESFSDYVAMATFNVFEDFVRKKYPLRSKLRNRTLYALTHDPALALWTYGGTSVCGLAAWKGSAPSNASPMALTLDVRTDLRLALRSMFAKIGAARSVEDVVSDLSAATGIPRNETPQPLDAASEISSTKDPSVELHNLQHLQKLWQEIKELPLRQRIALLLQARDATGESVTDLLPLSGVATTHEIAQSLQMSDEEFASLLPRLPVDDLTLAKRLDMTRQQVINLRRTARSRLLRRMREPDIRRRE